MSTDSAAESSGMESRRYSNGSNIRWDREAMSQQAEKVRREREERFRIRAQRQRELELERASKGDIATPTPREKRDKKMLARRRPHLSEIFDIDTSLAPEPEQSEPSTPVPTERRSKSPTGDNRPIDPVVAATLALLQQSYGLIPDDTDPPAAYDSIPNESSPPVEPLKPRKNGSQLMRRPRPAGFVAISNDSSEGDYTFIN
jgi:hypothetical protein